MAATRRLRAIMFTDTVGYTESTQADESGALESLRQQQELIRPLIASHHGREVKSTGDGVLVEFDSALLATECAIEIQRRISERNTTPGVLPIQIRIGIHLGDVEERGTDILGDAVNIAARIEPAAEPGGICVSGAVREQVWNKISGQLEKLPARSLKGLQGSMDIYRVRIPRGTDSISPGSLGPNGIAVLPFANISPDPNDAYFADGLTEELITVLSQLQTLRVISRTSVMQYKGSSKTIGQIGSELGVNSVLEGGVRKAGNRLRITAQLIDVGSDGHLWARTFERELNDVFALQAEIAREVAQALEIELPSSESARLERRPPVKPESYLAYLRGRALFNAVWTERNYLGARALFEEALALDPNNARAHSGLADVLRYIHYANYGDPHPDWDRTSRMHVARALEIDPELAEGHCSLGSIHWDNFEYEEAETEMRRALSLNPSYTQAHHWYAGILLDEARTDEALQQSRLAEQLDPQSTLNLRWLALTLILRRELGQVPPCLVRLERLDEGGPRYLETQAYYLFARGEFVEASRVVDRLVALGGDRAWVERVWTLAGLGKKEEARQLLQEREAMRVPTGYSTTAEGYALIGDFDAAFRVLDTAVAERNVSLQILRNEPTLEPLRRDPRFLALLKRIHLA